MLFLAAQPGFKGTSGRKIQDPEISGNVYCGRVYKDSNEFMEWVFKRKDLPLEELPEETSLQKNMKAHLLSGGWVGEGMGCLKTEY